MGVLLVQRDIFVAIAHLNRLVGNTVRCCTESASESGFRSQFGYLIHRQMVHEVGTEIYGQRLQAQTKIIFCLIYYVMLNELQLLLSFVCWRFHSGSKNCVLQTSGICRYVRRNYLLLLVLLLCHSYTTIVNNNTNLPLKYLQKIAQNSLCY